MKGEIVALALALGAPSSFAQNSHQPTQVAKPSSDIAETTQLPVVSAAMTAHPSATSAAQSILPTLTPVRLEILTAINSRTNKKGETFPIRLADAVPLSDGGKLPAGLKGMGEIVHAAKSGFGGRPGELILAARYLEWNGVRIPLRSFSLQEPGRGRDQSTAAAAFNIAGGPAGALIGFMISGGEVSIPTGTFAYAKTASEIEFPPLSDVGVQAPAPASQSITQSSQQEGSLKP